MKKIINSPEAVVPEMLDGLLWMYPNLARLRDHNVVLRTDINDTRNKQVTIVSGGGSGHEPAHAGYVGAGMLSAAVAGEVFTSPPVDSVLAAIRAVAGTPGVLLVVKNYTGDRLNFGLAAEMARATGIPVESVIVADDVALAATQDRSARRGIAGTVLVHKIAGAAATRGDSLKTIAALAQAAADDIATMGVSLSAGTVPAIGKPSYLLGEHEVELGLGIHGEPGVRRVRLETADVLAGTLVESILAPRPLTPGERIAVLINNLGATTNMEIAIFARRALSLLHDHGFVIERVYAGTFVSSLEAAGLSLSLLRVDDERLSLLDAPASAPAWPNFSPFSITPLASRIIAPAETSSPASPAAPESKTGRTLYYLINAVCQSFLHAESDLSELDRAVGDGDLGTNLARAARAVQSKLTTYPLDNPVDTLRALAGTVQQALGGSSGPLYAVFLLRMAKSLEASGIDKPEAWAKACREGCVGISELGGAVQGERTMLDALIPFANSFSAACAVGRPAFQALEAGAAAAENGAEATAQMEPRKGRSSHLGTRALGHVDPGAVAVAICVRALTRAFAELGV